MPRFLNMLRICSSLAVAALVAIFSCSVSHCWLPLLRIEMFSPELCRSADCSRSFIEPAYLQAVDLLRLAISKVRFGSLCCISRKSPRTAPFTTMFISGKPPPASCQSFEFPPSTWSVWCQALWNVPLMLGNRSRRAACASAHCKKARRLLVATPCTCCARRPASCPSRCRLTPPPKGRQSISPTTALTAEYRITSMRRARSASSKPLSLVPRVPQPSACISQYSA
mmetsp:Transcript_11070/g.18533  ORF Transcript_11070/g.18533 Transcript_11070/m.18533 type:complete len:226 (-) Transcript_11070:28-705(-)